MRRHKVWKIGTKVSKEPANRFFFFHAEEQAGVSSKTLAIISMERHIPESMRIPRIQRLLDDRLKLCEIHKHKIMYVSRGRPLVRAYQLSPSPILGLFVNCR
jgi:hypothetical protein